MSRRVSMALALLLTSVAGFVIMSYSADQGLFGGGGSKGNNAAVQAPPTEVAPQPTAPPPQVVEQTIYRDVYVQGGVGSGSNPGSPGQPAPQDNGSQSTSEQAADSGGSAPVTTPGATQAPTAAPTAAPTPQPLSSRELSGTVSAKTSDSFTLTGGSAGTVVITVTPSTAYESDPHPSLSFAQITTGMKIKANVVTGPGGTPTGSNGAWVAKKVQELNPSEDD